MDTKNVNHMLNRLLTRNYDAEKGYQQVAEKVDSPELETLCQNNYKERYRFGHDIKEMEKQYGVKPDKGSSLVADAHRAWINVKDLITGNSDAAVIAEARRGEQMAIDDYMEAVESEALKPDDKKVLSEHLKSIKNSQDQLAKIEEQLKAAS